VVLHSTHCAYRGNISYDKMVVSILCLIKMRDLYYMVKPFWLKKKNPLKKKCQSVQKLNIQSVQWSAFTTSIMPQNPVWKKFRDCLKWFEKRLWWHETIISAGSGNNMIMQFYYTDSGFQIYTSFKSFRPIKQHSDWQFEWRRPLS